MSFGCEPTRMEDIYDLDLVPPERRAMLERQLEDHKALIDECLGKFPFEEVHREMSIMGYKWAFKAEAGSDDGYEPRVPTLDELQKCGRHLVEQVVLAYINQFRSQHGVARIGCGRLQAYLFGNMGLLELKFEPLQACAFMTH